MLGDYKAENLHHNAIAFDIVVKRLPKISDQDKFTVNVEVFGETASSNFMINPGRFKDCKIPASEMMFMIKNKSRKAIKEIYYLLHGEFGDGKFRKDKKNLTLRSIKYI